MFLSSDFADKTQMKKLTLVLKHSVEFIKISKLLKNRHRDLFISKKKNIQNTEKSAFFNIKIFLQLTSEIRVIRIDSKFTQFELR